MSGQKRDDLQGIRGFAILAVLLFHFFPEHFPNGYIGVDQFFVLSGYLIAMVCNREKTLNMEAVTQFYYRRIKRIVPLYALVIFLILLFIRFFLPWANFDLNVDSAWSAILFSTNLRGEDPNMAYATQLKLAEDAFTHTWSLAVEMQFYALVPVIFYVLKKCSCRTRTWFIGAIGIASCWLQLTIENEYTAFNGVLCRLWQFSIGIYSFFVTETVDSTKSEDDPLLNTKTNSYFGLEHNIIYSILHYCTAISLILPFSPHKLPDQYLRLVVVTLLTGGMMVCGRNVQSKLVSNRAISYLGDVSYALYLVHWPIFTYIKLQYPHSTTALCCGCLFSCVLSIFLKETYEKEYLRSNKPAIFSLILALYTLSIAFLIICKQVDSRRIFHMPADGGVFSNWTTEEIIQLNEDFTRNDNPSLRLSQCEYREGKGPFGWCEFKNVSSNGTRSITVFGNSYAPNLAPVIQEFCGSKTKRMVQISESCDLMLVAPVGKCMELYQKSVESIRESEPDVLFIMTRYQLLAMEKNEANVVKRLNNFTAAVKQKVYILNAFPTTSFEITNILNDHLHEGTVPEQSTLDAGRPFQPARDLLGRVVATCAKCELVDIMPALSINGTYNHFDESTGLSYFTNGMHLTPHGLNRLKPLFKQICDTL